MKIDWKVILGVLVAVVLLAIGFGVLVGRASVKPAVVENTIATSDTTMTRRLDLLENYIVRVLKDLPKLYPKRDTLYLPGEMIIIDSAMALGDIPPTEFTFKDSLPYRFNKTPHFLPYELTVNNRGIFYGYAVRTIPSEFDITLPGPARRWFAPYLALTAGYENKLRYGGGLGASFFDRFDLQARLTTPTDTFKLRPDIYFTLRLK